MVPNIIIANSSIIRAVSIVSSYVFRRKIELISSITLECQVDELTTQ
jgi:hypothetical protein